MPRPSSPTGSQSSEDIEIERTPSEERDLEPSDFRSRSPSPPSRSHSPMSLFRRHKSPSPIGIYRRHSQSPQPAHSSSVPYRHHSSMYRQASPSPIPLYRNQSHSPVRIYRHHSPSPVPIFRRQSPSTSKRRSPSPNSTRCHHQDISSIPISYTMRPPDLQPKLKVRRDLIAQGAAAAASDKNSPIGIFQRKLPEPPDICSSESRVFSSQSACVKSELTPPSQTLDPEEVSTPPAPTPISTPPPVPPKKHGFSIEEIMRR